MNIKLILILLTRIDLDCFISVTNLAKTSMMADKSLADQNSMMNVGRWV